MKVVEILFYDKNRVKLVVEMPDPNRYSTEHAPHIPRLLFKLFPHLARHRCDNDNGYTFKKESRATEIPHLFEHLIIEIQGQVQKSKILRGETQWNWRIDPRGRFHVYVDYENEILVLGAIRLAERIINALDEHKIDVIDLDSEIEKLKVLAQFDSTRQEESSASLELTPVRATSSASL
ncbi:MAG: cyanophycin synthetase family protein [Armatimonadota bacterium]